MNLLISILVISIVTSIIVLWATIPIYKEEKSDESDDEYHKRWEEAQKSDPREDLIRIYPFASGFDLAGNYLGSGGGKYVAVGARYKFTKDPDGKTDCWSWDTDIVYDRDITEKYFKKVSEISDKEIWDLKRKFEGDNNLKIRYGR